MTNATEDQVTYNRLAAKRKVLLNAAAEIEKTMSLFNGGSPLVGYNAPAGVPLAKPVAKAKPKAVAKAAPKAPAKKVSAKTGTAASAGAPTIGEKILALLAEGPASSAGISKECGGKSALTQLSVMVKNGHVKRTGKRGHSVYSKP